ncbi:hypothetical protein [Asticcacaulis excentricus]|uniref:Uncharacterized protein n=1 Tax=Asticcacaulis excentricus TaxID=78587 RepID=A0A3G9G2R2_9CAUL|nr:hypothetical protein [Asticcacaulis excentricus]BBF81600.1 hypothetical protein EM6_2202 [Asticcacaulis excentricus]
MAVTSFNIDDKMDQTLESLKAHYGATSKAEILRKAVALLSVASKNEAEDGTILLSDGKGKDIRVIVK